MPLPVSPSETILIQHKFILNLLGGINQTFTLRSDTKLYEFDNYRAPWGDQYNDHHQDADDKYNIKLAAETSQLRDYARNLVLNNVLELCEQSSLEANFQDTPDDPPYP